MAIHLNDLIETLTIDLRLMQIMKLGLHFGKSTRYKGRKWWRSIKLSSADDCSVHSWESSDSYIMFRKFACMLNNVSAFWSKVHLAVRKLRAGKWTSTFPNDLLLSFLQTLTTPVGISKMSLYSYLVFLRVCRMSVRLEVMHNFPLIELHHERLSSIWLKFYQCEVNLLHNSF